MIKKILIVDDSLVARLMIQHSIPSDKGYEVLVAVNGKEGVEKFKQFKPDVTFMDLTMPELDGFTAIEQILAISPEAIIIALTADIQVKSISRVTDLGAFAVVQKPPKPDIINGLIEKINLTKTI
jgi:two-component system, chemotaxis family, chemotaxis protein CheY